MKQVILARAEPADIPILAKINTLAYLPETITQIAWSNWPDDTFLLPHFVARIQEGFKNTQTHVFKATVPSTREIVGFICWTFEPAEDATALPIATPTGKLLQQMPQGMNLRFVQTVAPQVERLKECMRPTTHYCTAPEDNACWLDAQLMDAPSPTDLSSFAVAPKWQGKGIGSQLLRHCLAISDEARLPTWLIAFPGSHSLYARHGFVDVEHVDVDLNEWDQRKLRGYGIYRNYCMQRPPLDLVQGSPRPSA